MCCHSDFICKSKINKRNNKIITNAVPICKNLLKIDVREPKIVNTVDTLVPPDGKKFVLSGDRFSLISSDSAIFLLNF